jgi:peptide chain release factor 1
VLTHLPSGITVTVDGRDQHANRRAARAELERRLAVREATTQRTQLRELRRGQIGSGERGDKVRTYREQDGRVIDHRTGRQAALGAVLRGDLSGLHD